MRFMAFAIQGDAGLTPLHGFLERLARSCRIEDLTLADPLLEDAVMRIYREPSG